MIHFLTSLFDTADATMIVITVGITVLLATIGTSLSDHQFNKHAYGYLLIASFFVITIVKAKDFSGPEEQRVLLLQALDILTGLSLYGALMSITPDGDRTTVSLGLGTVAVAGYGLSLLTEGWLYDQLHYWIPVILVVVMFLGGIFLLYRIVEYLVTSWRERAGTW